MEKIKVYFLVFFLKCRIYRWNRVRFGLEVIYLFSFKGSNVFKELYGFFFVNWKYFRNV